MKLKNFLLKDWPIFLWLSWFFICCWTRFVYSSNFLAPASCLLDLGVVLVFSFIKGIPNILFSEFCSFFWGVFGVYLYHLDMISYRFAVHDIFGWSLIIVRYSAQLCELFTEVFNWLPLSHCINKKILVRSTFPFLMHIVWLW